MKGKEVEFMYKFYDILFGVGMWDLENGIFFRMFYDVWIIDMDMSVFFDWEIYGWFYWEGILLWFVDELVDMLVDVVSKNGIFFLNIFLMVDGIFF